MHLEQKVIRNDLPETDRLDPVLLGESRCSDAEPVELGGSTQPQLGLK
jgi:hypothetical protein